MKKSSTVMMHVQFDVEISKLSLFTELLQNEVSNLDMKQVGAGVYAQKPSRPQTAEIDESKGTCAIGISYIKSIGKGVEFDTSEDGQLGTVLESHGYAKTTASPLVSMLALKGYVKRSGKGKATVL